MSVCDVGHRCCTHPRQGLPLHDHYLPAHQCPQCAHVLAVANLAASEAECEALLAEHERTGR